MSVILVRNAAADLAFLAQDYDSIAAIQTTYTFSDMDIGAASPKRMVAACITHEDTDDTISSVTIGGVAATVYEARFSNSGWTSAAIAVAFVTSGATADVVVTLTGTQDGCGCATYAFKNVRSLTPLDSGFDDTAGAPSFTIDHTAGAVLLVSRGAQASGTSCTPTGWTARHDAAVPTSHRHSSGYDVLSSTASAQTVGANDGGTRNVMYGLVIR